MSTLSLSLSNVRYQGSARLLERRRVTTHPLLHPQKGRGTFDAHGVDGLLEDHVVGVLPRQDRGVLLQQPRRLGEAPPPRPTCPRPVSRGIPPPSAQKKGPASHEPLVRGPRAPHLCRGGGGTSQTASWGPGSRLCFRYFGPPYRRSFEEGISKGSAPSPPFDTSSNPAACAPGGANLRQSDAETHTPSLSIAPPPQFVPVAFPCTAEWTMNTPLEKDGEVGRSGQIDAKKSGHSA